MSRPIHRRTSLRTFRWWLAAIASLACAWPALAQFSRFGLVMGVRALRRLLQQPANHLVGRFKNGRADQNLQSRHLAAVRSLRLKGVDQLLDFFLLCQEDLRGEFFFESAMPLRVSAMT